MIAISPVDNSPNTLAMLLDYIISPPMMVQQDINDLPGNIII